MFIPDNSLLRQVSICEYYLKCIGNVTSRNKLTGNIPVRIFREALEIISRRHSFLSCIFFDQGDKIYYKKKASAVPLSIIENVKSEAERNNLYIQELNDSIDPYKQLWRVLLILDCKAEEINQDTDMEMILTLQHSICDGISILNLVKEIMEQIQALLAGKTLYETKPLPVSPALDTVLIDNSAFKNMNSIEGQDNEDFDRIESDFSIDKTRCKIHYIRDNFTAAETEALVAQCRSYGITVHAALCAAISKSTADIIDPAGRDLNLRLTSAVDLRRRFSFLPDKMHLVSYATLEPVMVANIHSGIPALAKQIMLALKGRLNKTNGLELIKAITECASYKDIANLRKIPVSLGISNAGKVDIAAEYNGFVLHATDFSASGKYNNIIMPVTTFNRSMGYLFLYTEPWFTTDCVQRLNQGFRQYLLDFIQDK